MAKSDQKLSFTRIARRYLTEHASVRDCLLRGLINYSALAREIADLYQVENVDALQIACRRFRSQREDSQGSSEAIVRKLVREAKIRVRNKIAVVTIAKPDDLEQIYSFQTTVRRARGDFNLIEADEAMTIVVSQDWVNEITKRFSSKVKKTSSGLVQIAMIFDRRIEITPGVVSFVYGLLADAGINVLEESSCWTDIMMVIKEADLTRAMRVLTLSEA